MTDETTGANGKQTPDFEQFILAEYNNIAQAFFNTVESISSFMKHYIVIASVPPALAAVLLDTQLPGNDAFIGTIVVNQWIIGGVLLLVALIGWLVMGYLINLRCDALLYARTVNGIRGYYLANSSLSASLLDLVNTLPTSNKVPAYREFTYFGFVVAVFTIIGTVYFATGLYLVLEASSRALACGFWSAVVAWAFAHGLLYWMLTAYREKSYLK